METTRAFLAILLSLAILLGYQYFFVKPVPVTPDQQVVPAETGQIPGQTASVISTPEGEVGVQSVVAATADDAAYQTPARQGKDIPIDALLYSAVISENGGLIKSFRLKKYRETIDEDSEIKELVTSDSNMMHPLNFFWGADPGQSEQAPRVTARR